MAPGTESESSSLLMSVIRSLSATGDNEQREREKSKLERDYRASDIKLDKLVNSNAAALADSISTYRSVLFRVSDALEKIRDVKSQLSSCRLKLRYKQDELKRLWGESEEQQAIIAILNEVQEVKDSNEEISECIAKNQWSKAGKLLATALKVVSGPLAQVEGLRELRNEIEIKRDTVYAAVLSDVENFIFESSCKSVLSTGAFQRVPSSGSGRENELKRLQQLLNPDVKEAILSKVETGKATEIEILKLSNYCQCLVDIGMLQEAAGKIEADMCPQFKKIIERTLEHTKRENNKNLHHFLGLVVRQIRLIVNALNQTRTAFATVANERKISIQLFSVKQVWTAAQVELQEFLNRHITVKAKTSDTSPTKRQVAAVDFRDQFSKKKPSKKSNLFTFDSSAHGLAMESKQNGNEEKQLPLLCDPGPENLPDAYVALQGLMRDIEIDIGCSGGKHCELFHYLTQEASRNVLEMLENELEWSLNEMSKKADSSYALITDQATLSSLEAKKPVYQWCISAEKLVRISCHLAANIPSMKEKVAEFLSRGLSLFLEKGESGYNSILEETEDRRIFSSAWIKDDDIARVLKTLPSWNALLHKGSKTPEHETPEEALSKFAKESQMLITNISDAPLSDREMINDLSKLKALATLHESLEWLTEKIVVHFTPVFKNTAELTSGSKIFKLPRGFLELSETCLLVLHLEVRVHCLFHLVSQMRDATYWLSSESQEPDIEVERLCRYLNDVDLLLSPVLQPAKQKYIIEGIGHLSGSILIKNASVIKKINAAGARKMVLNVITLHQTIGALSGRREPGLEKARQYYEMLILSVDELLDKILEGGKLFTQIEYEDALRLLHRSRGGPVGQHIDRLTDLFQEVGVRV